MSDKNSNNFLQTGPRDSVRSRRALRNIALAATGSLVLVSGALIVARRPVAGWLLETYLAGRGIAASVQIDRLEFAGADAKLRLGAATEPELSVERISVSFVWQGWSPHVATIVLVRPVVRLRYDGTRLSLGILQRLVDTPAAPPAAPRATAHGAKPAAQQALPDIAVEAATLYVATPDGTIEAIANGRFAGGHLRKLDASMRPVRVRSEGMSADIQGAHVWTDTQGALHAALRGDFSSRGAGESVAIRGGVLNLEARGLRLHELVDGGISASGQFTAQFAADALSTGAITVGGARAQIASSGRADTAGGMNLVTAITAEAGMTADAADAQAARVPVLGDDPVSRRALAAALRHFTLHIASLQVERAAGATSVRLRAPATLSGDNGTLITLAPRNGALFDASAGGGRGAGDLSVRGDGLPAITLAVSNYTWTTSANGKTALDAATHIEMTADLAGLRGAALTTDGHVSLREGEFQFALERCAEVQLAAIVHKRNPVLSNGHATLCSLPGKAIFATRPGGWNLQATWNGLSVRLPSAQAQMSGAHGNIALESTAGSPKGTIDVAGLRMSDAARTRRFAPLSAAGRLTLADNVWHGRFALSAVKQKGLGTVTLTHAMQSGRGRADIRLDGIVFSPEQGQPADLSPLLAPLARAEGKASFTGEAAWSARGVTSSGDLVFQNLDFVSPLGQVHGAEGRVHFISLAPLHTAPGQIVQARKIDWSTPLSGISATFELTPAAFTLSDAHAGMASGQVSLGPVNLALPADHVTEGEIRIHDVDIGKLVAASNLSKKMSLTARVSGTVPFRYGPEGLRFVDGKIATEGQGRLSIARSLWSGTGEQASSAVRNFAYQAMEDLAIDKLDGTINSLPNGRLGMLFHIKGRYDPKKAGDPSVDLFELLQGTALDRSIPLPKGTDVNLTLDTTLNFDELLAAYRKAWADTHAKD